MQLVWLRRDEIKCTSFASDLVRYERDAVRNYVIPSVARNLPSPSRSVRGRGERSEKQGMPGRMGVIAGKQHPPAPLRKRRGCMHNYVIPSVASVRSSAALVIPSAARNLPSPSRQRKGTRRAKQDAGDARDGNGQVALSSQLASITPTPLRSAKGEILHSATLRSE